MTAAIKDKKEVAKGTLRVEFTTKEEIPGFKAGQHATFFLINPPETDAEGDSRIFSIVTSPNEKGFLAMTTRLRDTAFKRVLRNLPPGAKVEIEDIRGNFVLPENPAKPLVFIAGGIGITPFMSMLTYLSEEGLNYQVTLIYSNRDRESTAYFEELKNLAEKNKNIKIIFIMTQDPNWTGEKRHIDKEFIKDFFTDPNAQTYYLAGPPAMVKAVYEALMGAGILPANIKTENFSGY